MNELDQNIITISDNICKSISQMTKDERGFHSQNILKRLRDLVEAVDVRIYCEHYDVESFDYDSIPKALEYVASRGDLRFLNVFHNFLQASVSHYTLDEDGSIRMMLKYYEWIIRIKDYVKRCFNLDILYNLEDYPLNQDESLCEYYEKIAEKLDSVKYNSDNPNYRFYIQKNKPFFINGKVYYEITITPADDFSSKFNRFTVFSNKEIPSNYAIKLSFIDTFIKVLNRSMPIRIINSYKVAIRPVEFLDLSNILGVRTVGTNTKEYYAMMDHLTETGRSFTEIIDLDNFSYESLKAQIQNVSQSNNLFTMLDMCREFSKKCKKGYVILRYLLLQLRHKVLKQQTNDKPNNWISYLKLKNECLPFEEMPFSSSLYKHNPLLRDVMLCVNINGREHELLYRKVKINTEQNAQLYTLLDSMQSLGDVSDLIKKFNERLIPSHVSTRKLIVESNNIYINGYEADTLYIIRDLIARMGVGLQGYVNAMTTWLINNPTVDCEEKRKILVKLFAQSDLALIYGAAGTGKTTLIKYIASFFANEKKLFLANTNPAKENLRRNIKIANSEFSTIASSKQIIRNNHYDIVFVDESSTVDNYSMRNLLENISCRLLVLVGDVYQIQSIKFGNWFNLARYFLPNNIIYELTTPYRSQNKKLKVLWDRVRKIDSKMSEYIVKNKYTSMFDDTIFERYEQDEIILCLNYDGLYGINNINRFLQEDNPNDAVYWDAWMYKVGDPIIFNEFNRFYPTLYNNLKGWIRSIQKTDSSITFEIEIDMVLNEFGAAEIGVELLECNIPGHSLIKFSVAHYVDDDIVERDDRQVVPFQVAYAISIHKAQGLEYDSVKVIITNAVEDLITHNIFYTAITRARKSLKIYWTPETQQKVLQEITPISNKRDAYIISNKHGIQIQNNV